MALSTAQRRKILTNLGFRVNTTKRYSQAVADFQRGWCLGEALKVDGKAGPKTDASLAKSELARRKGTGTLSKHFSYKEFACKCGGKYASCRRIWVARSLIVGLERYRTATKRTISITSGCRCLGHNRAVGGASKSQHMAGRAADVQYFAGWTDSRVAKLGLFSGIGFSKKTHLVRHVDVRTGASKTHPTDWKYAR